MYGYYEAIKYLKINTTKQSDINISECKIDEFFNLFIELQVEAPETKETFLYPYGAGHASVTKYFPDTEKLSIRITDITYTTYSTTDAVIDGTDEDILSNEHEELINFTVEDTIKWLKDKTPLSDNQINCIMKAIVDYAYEVDMQRVDDDWEY